MQRNSLNYASITAHVAMSLRLFLNILLSVYVNISSLREFHKSAYVTNCYHRQSILHHYIMHSKLLWLCAIWQGILDTSIVLYVQYIFCIWLILCRCVLNCCYFRIAVMFPYHVTFRCLANVNVLRYVCYMRSPFRLSVVCLLSVTLVCTLLSRLEFSAIFFTIR